MKIITVLNNATKLVLILALSFLASCKSNPDKTSTQKPALSDYSMGEKWVWKFKGVSDQGEIRSKGTDTKTIVDFKGKLGLTVGNDTILVSEIVKPSKSKTPRFQWPLEVEKKWVYQSDFESADGSTKGKFIQDAEVVSYKEVTVEAGTFMAYTIEYKGKITNNRGLNTRTDDVWIYAPKIKNFIYMTQEQDGFSYTEELIEYSNKNN